MGVEIVKAWQNWGLLVCSPQIFGTIWAKRKFSIWSSLGSEYLRILESLLSTEKMGWHADWKVLIRNLSEINWNRSIMGNSPSSDCMTMIGVDIRYPMITLKILLWSLKSLIYSLLFLHVESAWQPYSKFTRSVRKVSGLPLYIRAIVFERPLRGMNVNSKASRTYRLLADICRTYSSCAACLCLQSYFRVRADFVIVKND